MKDFAFSEFRVFDNSLRYVYKFHYEGVRVLQKAFCFMIYHDWAVSHGLGSNLWSDHQLSNPRLSHSESFIFLGQVYIMKMSIYKLFFDTSKASIIDLMKVINKHCKTMC